MKSPFRCFSSSPEVIRLTVMIYLRYLVSLREVEDLLAERGIDICHETVRFCGGGDEALRTAAIVGHGPASVPSNGHEDAEYRRPSEVWPVAQQPSGKLTSAVSKTGRDDGFVSRHQDLQKFGSVHASIYNHFNHDRNLNRRDIFKYSRAAALAEWHQLVA